MKSCCDTYCANYGCHQGRDCPVRMKHAHEARELRDQGKAESLSTAWEWAALFLLGLGFCWLLVVLYQLNMELAK